MKIISKWKDYYDHEVAYFGYDDSRVYDRRAFPTSKFDPHCRYSTSYNFVICDKLFPMIIKNGLFHTEPSKLLDNWENMFLDDRGVSTNLNQKTGQPVLLVRQGYTIPILSTFGFASIIDSRTMYGMIYDFLGWLKDNPPPPDNQTNKEKIISHGFDIKTSFRPKMKNENISSKLFQTNP